MQTRGIVASVVVLVALACTAPAIDRDAHMIDTIAIESIQYDGGESLGGSLWGETATAEEQGKWAILFGGGVGTLWPNAGVGLDYWEVGLGLKYYLLQDTSVAVVGTFRRLDIADDPDVRTAEARFKHRLIRAADTVSPFLAAGIGLRSVEFIPEQAVDRDFEEALFSYGAGCDFMMSDDFAFVFEAIWYQTEAMDEDETPDWWMGRIGMQYYWE